MVVPAVTSRPSMNESSTLAPESVGLARCLSCHAEDPTVTNRALEAGADWRCWRCGQRWDAARLVTVAAYGAWLSDRTAAAAERLTVRGDA